MNQVGIDSEGLGKLVILYPNNSQFQAEFTKPVRHKHIQPKFNKPGDWLVWSSLLGIFILIRWTCCFDEVDYLSHCSV